MKKVALLALVLIVLNLVLAVPVVSHAALVPCGNSENALTGPPAPADKYRPCTFADFLTLLVKIVQYLTILVMPIAAIGIGVGGMLMIFGAVDPAQQSKGKTIIKDAAIGLVITFGVFLLLRTVLRGLEARTGAGGVFQDPLENTGGL